MGVKVTGVEALNRKFKAMPKAVEERLKRAMAKSADEIVRDMKRLVAKDTGALGDSISWTWGDAPAGAMTIAQASAGEGTIRLTIYAGTRDKKLGDRDAFYARFVEFGTRKMAAKPFFFPAYRSNRKRAANRIKSGIRRAVKDVMAGKLTIGADE